MAGITLTGEWKPCVGCSKAKVHRFPVPTMSNEKADEPIGGVVCNFAEVMKHPSVGKKHFGMIFVDDYSRVKRVRFLQKKG